MITQQVRAFTGTCLAAEIRLHLTILVSTEETFDVRYLGEPEPSSHDHEPPEPPCKVCGWGL